MFFNACSDSTKKKEFLKIFIKIFNTKNGDEK